MMFNQIGYRLKCLFFEKKTMMVNCIELFIFYHCFFIQNLSLSKWNEIKQLSSCNGGGGEQKIDPDNDWCDPTDVAEDLDNSALKKLTLNEDLEKSVHQRMQIFYDFVKVTIFLFGVI